MTRLDFYWLALFSITQQQWLTLTNSNIQYIRQIQINMFHELKKKSEKAQSGLGLEHPEKTLWSTRRRCRIPDIPSSNLGFGNNRYKGVDPSWVSLWNRLRCPLMSDRWSKWNRQKYMNWYVHMPRKANLYDTGKDPKVDEGCAGFVAEVTAPHSSSATPCPPRRHRQCYPKRC